MNCCVDRKYCMVYGYGMVYASENKIISLKIFRRILDC